jgi:isopentenyl phosphate kinase
LDNSNYDILHGGGGFSHVYVIMHKYFSKNLEMQKMSTQVLIYNLTCFFA